MGYKEEGEEEEEGGELGRARRRQVVSDFFLLTEESAKNGEAAVRVTQKLTSPSMTELTAARLGRTGTSFKPFLGQTSISPKSAFFF